jgi:hypothetical protein
MNTFSPNYGSTSCTACPGSKPYSGEGSSQCSKCPGGQHLVNGNCVECNPGKYSGPNNCNPCISGTYLQGSNFSCLPCPIGKTSNIDGAQDISQCNIECDYGEFGEVTYSYSNYQGSKKSICSKCPVGKYSNIKGATSCLNCPNDRRYTLPYTSNWYGANGGDTSRIYKASSIDSCFALLSGYYLDTQSNEPSTCSAYGMVYEENNNSCQFCPENKKLFSGSTLEKSSIGNFYSNNNLLFPVSAFCVASCPNGTLAVKINNIDTCQCPSKSHPSFVNGVYTCECDFNARRVSSGKCKFCKRGKIMVNGECKSCPVNTYANRGDLHCSSTFPL